MHLLVFFCADIVLLISGTHTFIFTRIPISKSEAKNALAAFISFVHKSLRTLFWYRVYDNCHDDPKSVQTPNTDSDKRREAIEKKQHLHGLYQISFHLEMGLVAPR